MRIKWESPEQKAGAIRHLVAIPAIERGLRSSETYSAGRSWQMASQRVDKTSIGSNPTTRDRGSGIVPSTWSTGGLQSSVLPETMT